MKCLIAPLVSLVLAQVVKFIIESVKSRKLKWARLLNGSGGMPSSHTSFTFALATIILLECGVDSPEFAISLVFSMITAYDAMGLRKESGKHAAILNHMMDELIEGDKGKAFTKLKEQLGHNPCEVLVGIIFGIIVATVVYFI